MSRELARKQPAGIFPRTEIMTAPLHRRKDLVDELSRMVKRREIGAAYTMRQVPHGWAVKVVRIREAPGWWERNWLKLTLFTSAGAGLLAAIAYLVRMIVIAVTAALTVLVPIGIGVIVLLAIGRTLGGGRVIEVIQKVTIRG